MTKRRFECCINCEKRVNGKEESCHDRCVKYIAACLAKSEEKENRVKEAKINRLLQKPRKPKKKNEWSIKPRRRRK